MLEIDAASNRGIDEIRDLKEKINFAPTLAKSKTYIIDEVHMLTKEAFNALLKTLEEPPTNVYFILCTTEVHKIPETIISRCQRFDFKRIDVRTIMTRLNYIAQMEKIEAEEEAIDLIARHVEGGLRDAIGLFEQMVISGKLASHHVRSHLGITGHDTILALLEALEKKDLPKTLRIIDEVHREGYDLMSFVREILECLRDRLLNSIQPGQSGTDMWLQIINYFEEAREALRNTVIPQLPLEIAAIKICGQAEPKAELPNNLPEGQNLINTTPENTESTEKAQKEEIKTAQSLKKEYEMEAYEGNLEKHWPRVLEHVSPPSLRRSLSDAKISENGDSGVTLTFSSKFHHEKVNLTENRVKIEKAIHHIFGKQTKVECCLNQEAPPPINTEKPAPKPKKSVEDLTKKAMEMFGEE